MTHKPTNTSPNAQNLTAVPHLTAQQNTAQQPEQVERRSYQPPTITTSGIFHKVLLAGPADGIPGCSTY